MTAHDPYENYRFRLKWDDSHVAGFATVGGLDRTHEPVEHREGGDPAAARHPAGRAAYPTIVLERGVTYDAAFQAWATQARGAGSPLHANVARREVIVDVYDEAGQPALSYEVHGAWVSEYQALPDLDAGANAVTIQHLKLEHDGIERDGS